MPEILNGEARDQLTAKRNSCNSAIDEISELVKYGASFTAAARSAKITTARDKAAAVGVDLAQWQGRAAAPPPELTNQQALDLLKARQQDIRNAGQELEEVDRYAAELTSAAKTSRLRSVRTSAGTTGLDLTEWQGNP